MNLPLPLDYAPMEAKLVDRLPAGDAWRYEPKWDGFRCLAFKDGDEVDLRSKSGQPFNRYFPEVVAAVRSIDAPCAVLDGELVVPEGDALSFDTLLLRIHPAASRVARLSAEHPALLVLFDLLVAADRASLVDRTQAARRKALEAFAASHLDGTTGVRLSPEVASLPEVDGWLAALGSGLDGVIAKRADLAYRSGERDGMQKWKRMRTADCVVGGFRYAAAGKVVGSLLLGLYDAAGRLDHVGFTSSLAAAEREALARELQALEAPPGFTGRAPGGPSRWATERSSEWRPLAPRLVAEVQYDHWSGGRFRHGTRFLRWRPDKAPSQCTVAQVEQESSATLALLDGVVPPAKPKQRRIRPG